MLVHDVVPQQKIASRFINPISPVQTSRNRTRINMGGSNNANMWSTHTSTTTSMAVEAPSAPHHVVTKSSSINRRSGEQTPEYCNTVHVTQVRHTWIPVCAQRDKTQHSAYRKTHAVQARINCEDWFRVLVTQQTLDSRRQPRGAADRLSGCRSWRRPLRGPRD